MLKMDPKSGEDPSEIYRRKKIDLLIMGNNFTHYFLLN